jgi:hypothetical protein
MVGNVVISEVDVLTYVVLSVAEKHVSYREYVGATECTVINEVPHAKNRGRYNRVQQ